MLVLSSKSAVDTSTPCSGSSGLGRGRTMARTATPRADNSLSSSLPLVPVARVTRIMRDLHQSEPSCVATHLGTQPLPLRDRVGDNSAAKPCSRATAAFPQLAARGSRARHQMSLARPESNARLANALTKPPPATTGAGLRRARRVALCPKSRLPPPLRTLCNPELEASKSLHDCENGTRRHFQRTRSQTTMGTASVCLVWRLSLLLNENRQSLRAADHRGLKS
jgi:hypothetical protein